MEQVMKKTFLAAILALGAMTAQTAGAQMRVVGPRPVDPRLRNHPQQVDQTAQTQGTDAKGAAGAAQVPVIDATASVRRPAGNTLQRPSYLQGDESGAPAAGPSSIDLMKQCFDGSISGSIVNPTCIGYMAGAIGAIRMAAQASETFPICLPEVGVTNESVVGDVSAYLEQNTDSLQKSARSVVFLVLSQRYPCAKQGK